MADETGSSIRVRFDRAPLLFRAAYLLFIVLATVGALEPTPPWLVRERMIAAVPIDLTTRDGIDAARNILLFAGWGLVWVVTSARAAFTREVVLRATITGLAVSLGVEAAQLFSSVRTTSLIDVTTNTAGAAVGALGAVTALRLVAVGRRRRTLLGLPMAVFALCYAGAAGAEAFSPLFRQDRVPGAWGSPFERFRDVVAFMDAGSILQLSVGDFVLFVPFGILGAVALAEAGVRARAAAIGTTLIGAVLFACAELAHGVAGYVIAIGPVLGHVAGVSAGAALAYYALSRSPGLSLGRGARTDAGIADDLLRQVFFWGYAAVLAIWSWRPFLPEFSIQAIRERLSYEHLIPFNTYLERTDLFTVADASVSFFLFLPIGSLLAWRPLRDDGILGGLWPGVLLVVGLEAGQLFVAGRWPDATDIVISVVAIGVGAALVRRAIS